MKKENYNLRKSKIALSKITNVSALRNTVFGSEKLRPCCLCSRVSIIPQEHNIEDVLNDNSRQAVSQCLQEKLDLSLDCDTISSGIAFVLIVRFLI
jgi:hypothetical protein